MSYKAVPKVDLYENAAKTASVLDCEDILFTFKTNLNRDNQPFYSVSAVTKTHIHICSGDGNVISVSISEMDEIEYIQYVGCASIEYTVCGERAELCRSDMKNSLALQNTVKRLKSIKQGNYSLNLKEHDDETCCPKCGTPYRSYSKVCPMCADRKKLITEFYPFIKPFMIPLIITVLLFFATTGLSVLSGSINQELVDGYLHTDAPGTMNGFFMIIGAMIGIALLQTLIPMLRQYMLIKIGNKITINLRDTVYKKVQEMSIARVSKHTSGEIITRITHDVEVVQDFLTSTLPEILRIVLTFVGIAAAMFIMNWKLTLMILLPTPIIILIFYVTRRFLHTIYHRQWIAESAINTLLHDTFSGIRIVKVFGTEEIEEKKFDSAARKVADLSIKNELTWNKIMPFANFLLGIGEYAVLFVLGTQILDGEATLGEMTKFLSYVGLIYGPLRQAAFLPRRFARSMTSVAKVFEIIDEETDVANKKDAVEKVIDGNIHIENVSFGYNSYKEVLRNITADINKGEMVGIVGRSGVGKSTLINLIMRLYDVNSGQITIDGIDIRDYDQHCLRSQIGVVLQETFLFKGTICSNIAYALPGCTADEVIRASKLANAHQFIMKLPDGYNTIVGERGQTLSGGERQRIAIARAVLRNPKILILDEATSALDTKTEKLIQDALNKLIKGRTTIAIAHRLSTLRNATKLIVLEKDGIEEIGTHEELIANKKRYYKLVMAQRQMSKMKK